MKKVASSALLSNTQVLFLKTTIILQSAAEVHYGCACLQILQNNRSSLLDGSLVLLVCTPTPQESQGEMTLWVLHSTQACPQPVWQCSSAQCPAIHGHMRCPGEQEPLLLWHLPSLPAISNLISPRFMFALTHFLKSVKYKLSPCVCVLFSFLDITSGTFLAQRSVYPWASCPSLLEGHFALILLPLATCPAFWNQVPGIQGPLLLLSLFAPLCVSSLLLSAWLYS